MEKIVGICIVAAVWEAIFFQNLAIQRLFKKTSLSYLDVSIKASPESVYY